MVLSFHLCLMKAKTYNGSIYKWVLLLMKNLLMTTHPQGTPYTPRKTERNNACGFNEQSHSNALNQFGANLENAFESIPNRNISIV